MEAADHFETLDDSVRRHVVDALTVAQGNQGRAATLLGVTRWKLARMITRFELRDFVTRIRNAGRDLSEASVAGEVTPEASCAADAQSIQHATTPGASGV